MVGKYTTIYVKKETYEKLAELKKRTLKKTWNELMTTLIEAYEAYQKANIARIMCGELADVSASPLEWWNLLYSKIGDRELAVEVFEYLKPKQGEPNRLIVDKEKCK